jgi:hypothetical protein
MEFSTVKYRILAGLFIGIFAAPALWAANVSVLVMESGESRENTGNQYAALWENGLMDAFFDSGHIVTNSPKMQITGKPAGDFPAEAERDFNNAKEGGMEYFLIAFIDYSTPLVSLRLFDIRSTKMVLEQKHAVTTFRNTKEENEKIQAAAVVMAAQLR